MRRRVFEWDVAKAASNKRKHGATFDEAASVFDDPSVLIEFDAAHSTDDEARRLAIGMSNRLRLLAVVYTKVNDETLRLISARRATKAESKRYAEQY